MNDLLSVVQAFKLPGMLGVSLPLSGLVQIPSSPATPLATEECTVDSFAPAFFQAICKKESPAF
jgi:hypothetical protein